MARYVEYDDTIILVKELRAIQREGIDAAYDKFTFHYEHQNLVIYVLKKDSNELFDKIKDQIYRQ